MSNLNELQQKILQYLVKQNSNPDGKPYELEIRIGHFAKNKDGVTSFNTNLGKSAHNKINKYLRKQYWASVNEGEFLEYKNKGERIRFGEHGDVIESISKKRVKETDFTIEGYPFAVRISLSVEHQIDPKPSGPETSWNKVKKKRMTFQRELFSIDLTSSRYKKQDIYQEEIEIHQLHLSDRAEQHFAQELTNQTLNMLQVLAPLQP